MKAIIKTAAVSLIAFASAAAFAASTTDVTVDGATQNQSGNRNEQNLDVGNAKASTFAGAHTHVKTKTISQTQSGSRNNQGMNPANAE